MSDFYMHMFFSNWKDAILCRFNFKTMPLHSNFTDEKKKSFEQNNPLTPILVLFKQRMELVDSKYRDYCKVHEEENFRTDAF